MPSKAISARRAPHRELWDRATDLLPAADVGRYTQGLMDLGATVCLARSPHCLLCPAADLCVAARNGTVDRYPVKVRRLRRGTREHVWLWLAWRDRLWLTRRPEQGVWAGLWSLPELASEAELDAMTRGLARRARDPVELHARPDPSRLDAAPAALGRAGPNGRARVDAMTGRWADGQWFTRAEALALGLPAPLRRLLSE